MASSCSEARSTQINPPKKLDWNAETTVYLSDSPFTLNGRVYSTPPRGLNQTSEKRRKSSAYLGPDNYEIMNLETQNIIGEDTATTLRYDGISFTQKFIALHKNLFNNSGVSVSLLFSDFGNSRFFHICIPVEFTTDEKEENLFLKHWLYTNPPSQPPSNMTTNELLNFYKTDKVKFYTATYCLSYNLESISSTYTLCQIKNDVSLKINKINLPRWIQDDDKMSRTSTNTKKTFDQILNLVLRGTFKKVIPEPSGNFVDSNLVSSEIYFDGTRTNDIVGPIYYNVKVQSLLGKQIKQTSGPKFLQNIKCYPIDLAKQVDKEGNIVVDEETNKPLSISDATGLTEKQAYDPKIELEAKKNKDWWIFFIITTVVFLILVIAAIIFIVLVFQGRSLAPAAVTPAALAPVASASGSATP